MAQYRIGTVNVTNGSPIVTGVGTEWLANVTGAKDYLVVLGVAGEDIHRLIQTVDSDTQLTLAAPFGGVTDTGRTYTIIRDFTANGQYPLMDRQDQAFQEIWNLAMTLIDDDFTTTPFTLPVLDTQPLVEDNVDSTKRVRIDVGDTPTATTLALLMPDENVDFRAPAAKTRRKFNRPILGDSLVGVNAFNADPDDANSMLSELLQCDNSTVTFQLNFPDPATIPDWDGLLCWLRPTSNNNLFAITVPNAGDFSWNNGYANNNQNLTTLYLGLNQANVVGNSLPVFKRGSKIIVWGPVRGGANEDYLHRFGTADANAQGGVISNYANRKNVEGATYTFVVEDAGGVKEYAGGTPATWTVPDLAVPVNSSISIAVHNLGTANLTFTPSGVTFRGLGNVVLEPDRTCSLSWVGGSRVKLTGELS